MSGHYATLLRGTVEAFLPTHEVYITDWSDARMVPLVGRHIRPRRLHRLSHRNVSRAWRGRLHTLGVCQPAVPLIAAVAQMAANDDAFVPASMTLMGGPIDTRRSPTAVNQLAQRRGAAMVPAQLHSQRALSLSRDGAPGLSGLPAIVRLHGDEHRSTCQRAFRNVQPSRRRATVTRPRSTAISTTNIWPSWI